MKNENEYIFWSVNIMPRNRLTADILADKFIEQFFSTWHVRYRTEQQDQRKKTSQQSKSNMQKMSINVTVFLFFT